MKKLTVILAIMLMVSFNAMASDRPIIDVNSSMVILYKTIDDMSMSAQFEAFGSDMLARYFFLTDRGRAPELKIDVSTDKETLLEALMMGYVVVTYSWEESDIAFTFKAQSLTDSDTEYWLEFDSKKSEPDINRAFALYYSQYGSPLDDLSEFFKALEVGVQIDIETELFPYVADFTPVIQYYIEDPKAGKVNVSSYDKVFTHKIRVFD